MGKIKFQVLLSRIFMVTCAVGLICLAFEVSGRMKVQREIEKHYNTNIEKYLTRAVESMHPDEVGNWKYRLSKAVFREVDGRIAFNDIRAELEGDAEWNIEKASSEEVKKARKAAECLRQLDVWYLEAYEQMNLFHKSASHRRAWFEAFKVRLELETKFTFE
ncbi:MAG TPA: hypothetical protein VIT68_00240 [Candidatus Gracilibacteria bacterium]